jgi:hypothetical protein
MSGAIEEKAHAQNYAAKSISDDGRESVLAAVRRRRERVI